MVTPSQTATQLWCSIILMATAIQDNLGAQDRVKMDGESEELTDPEDDIVPKKRKHEDSGQSGGACTATANVVFLSNSGSS